MYMNVSVGLLVTPCPTSPPRTSLRKRIPLLQTDFPAKLVEPGSILASTGALSNERRVSGEDDSLSHSAIALPTDLSIAKLL